MLLLESSSYRSGHICLSVVSRVPDPGAQIKAGVVRNSAEVYFLWDVFPMVYWIFLGLALK